MAQGTPGENAWEAAYVRFETPEQEIRKFMHRLRRLGAETWPRDARILDLFCGRGNGLHALTRLGFTRLVGVDLSAALLRRYTGAAQRYQGDCRGLPFGDDSADIIVIQGGLHHLEALPDDLDRTLSEVHRVLRDGGRVAVVEPWATPFLAFVHFLSSQKLVRRVSPRVDAFATMFEHERATYEQWLRQPATVLALLEKYFACERSWRGWGKLMFVGTKKAAGTSVPHKP